MKRPVCVPRTGRVVKVAMTIEGPKHFRPKNAEKAPGRLLRHVGVQRFTINTMEAFYAKKPTKMYKVPKTHGTHHASEDPDELFKSTKLDM